MKLIVGLGNPGEKYKDTRHNIGFMVVDKFVKSNLSLFPSLKAWKKEETFLAEVCKLEELFVIKPQTFMNMSGQAVAKFSSYYKIAVPDIWVIHDDIDLPLGKVRIRKGGGSAGHRGIESMIASLGSGDFIRIRLGIGRGKMETVKTTDINLHRQDIEKYVVSPFRDHEAGDTKKLIKHAVEALEIGRKDGIEKR